MNAAAETEIQTTPTSHTPGPWGVIDNGGDVRPEAIYAPKAGGYIVATTWAIVPEPQRKANAHLIAAAPELLASLEKLAGHVAHYAAMPHAHSEADKDFAEARRAIAKAKGQS